MVKNDVVRSIINSIAENVNEYWVSKLSTCNSQVHIAIMIEPYLSRIFNGSKTLESRFSKKRIVPYECVSPGDIIILKKSGGAVAGIFEAGDVFSHNICRDANIDDMRSIYGSRLSVEENFWQAKKDSRYVTIVEIKNLQEIKPIIVKERNRQSWLVLGRMDKFVNT